MFHIAPERRHLAFLCAGIVAVHLVFLYALVNFYAAHGIDFQTRIESQDSGQYIALAHAITQGDFARDGAPEVFRTPGYPAFAALVLGLSGGSFWALLFVQVLLAAGVGVLTYFLSKELVFTHRFSLVLAALAGLGPAMLLTTLTGMGVDVLYTLFFGVGVFLLFRLERRPLHTALIIGLLLGLATLVRPVGLYASLPVFATIFFFLPARLSKKGKLRVLFISLLVCCAVVVPWMFRNYSVAGHFALSSVPAYNIVFYNLPLFLASEHGTSVAEERTRLLQPLAGTDDVALRSFASTEALKKIARDTLTEEGLVRYAVFHLTQTAPFFVGSGINVLNAVITADTEGNTGAFRIAVLAERAVWAALFALAFVSPLFAHGRVRIFLLLCVVLILANAILTSPVSQPRYRLPVEPFVFVAAAYAATALLARLRSRIQKPIIADTPSSL